MYNYTCEALAGMYMRNFSYWLAAERCEGASTLELQAIPSARLGGFMYADGYGAASVFAITVMALLARKRFGIGQYVQSSMMTSGLYAYSDEFVDYAGMPEFNRPDPDQMGIQANYRLYRASDGWVFLAAPTELLWDRLAMALAREDLLSGALVSNLTASPEQINAHIECELAKEISRRSALIWERELSALGIGCSAVSPTPPSGFTSFDQQLFGSGQTVLVNHPTVGTLVAPGPAGAFSETPGRIRPAAQYGQHTAALLMELGYSQDEIAVLIARGTAFVPESRGLRSSRGTTERSPATAPAMDQAQFR